MQLPRTDGHLDQGGSTRRCANCDADVLFLSTCPACGTPTGNGKTPTGNGKTPTGNGKTPTGNGTAHAAAGVGRLFSFAPAGQATTEPEMAKVLSFADAARARSTALPAALTKAWQEPPSRRPRSDEWSAGRSAGVRPTGAHRKHPARHRRLVLGLCASAVLLAGVIGIVVNESLSQPGGHSATADSPTRFVAGGAAFEALFPSSPATLAQHLSFAGKPYVAYSYMIEQGATTLSVGVYPLPIGPIPPHATVQSLARGFLRSASAAGTARVTAGSTTRVGNLPAVTIAGTARTGTAAVGTLIFDGHVLYEILAVGPAHGLAASLERFQSHFRVVDWKHGFTT